MMTRQQEPQKIYLSDYKAPDFQVENFELWFDIHEDLCRVRSKMRLKQIQKNAPLVLDGEDILPKWIKLDETILTENQYTLTKETLSISNVPSEFTLEIEVELNPTQNTSLEGLYVSGKSLTTQCEAQGFRKITYFIDRPDVMTTYLVHIEADAKKYPILLSNGNCIESKTLTNGRKLVTWQDPFKKPCYLFALVAGDLASIHDHFITASGKKVNLEIYCAPGQESKCSFAMESIKKSMKWDEERFGREYDLSTYMVVAMDDFNAGAMENKGLNIFNSKLVLADAQTATDGNYFAIESVIAHEYFHNWTGNRVTLRDWFHLSLKEGLTVFRDQEFSMDLHSRPMIRIDTVADLRAGQFAEDAGPNSHPIRPSSCYAVDNFFTSTIYEKGAEVIRMMQTMVGRPGFRKGMDLYFSRHDGQAVIIEDFAKAISDPNNQDWSQFKLWYSQAGTPQVQVQENYNSQTQTLTLELSQNCPARANEEPKKPFHIPLVIGLLDKATGQDLKLESADIATNTEGQTLVHLKNEKQNFIFKNLSQKPILSLNRGFSAPIHLNWEASEEELLFLLSHDSDAFNRWESCQKLMIRDLQSLIKSAKKGLALTPSSSLQVALAKSLRDSSLDLSLKAKLLELPTYSYLTQLESEFVAEAFAQAKQTWMTSFAKANESLLIEIYNSYHGKSDNRIDHLAMGERRLKNHALEYLSLLPAHHNLTKNQMLKASHMTDEESATALCLELPTEIRNLAINHFFDRYHSDSVTINKWFALQAMSEHPQTNARVRELWSHPVFQAKNPNRVYSLLARWGANLTQFHSEEGANYQWMAERIVELDRLNPQVATRVSSCFDLCLKVSDKAKTQAKQSLGWAIEQKLSKNCFEIVSKIYNEL